MDGILNVLKPPGMTSHDVVAWVRRQCDGARVGHAGTLDPGAAGVLLLCLGRATRLAEFMSDFDKVYRAEVAFGIGTDTLDRFGQVREVADASALTESAVFSACAKFLGPVLQIPPMVSAVRHGGTHLYELARKGLEVARPARRVEIRRLDVLSFCAGAVAIARLEVACSKGTYIRSLAADLGAVLGIPAHLQHLVRTAAGPFTLATSVTVEELAANGPRPFLLNAATAVAHLPAVRLGRAAAQAARQGVAPAVPLTWQGSGGGVVALIGPEGELVAVAEAVPGSPPRFRLRKVLVGAEGHR